MTKMLDFFVQNHYNDFYHKNNLYSYDAYYSCVA